MFLLPNSASCFCRVSWPRAQMFKKGNRMYRKSQYVIHQTNDLKTKSFSMKRTFKNNVQYVPLPFDTQRAIICIRESYKFPYKVTEYTGYDDVPTYTKPTIEKQSSFTYQQSTRRIYSIKFNLERSTTCI